MHLQQQLRKVQHGRCGRRRWTQPGGVRQCCCCCCFCCRRSFCGGHRNAVAVRATHVDSTQGLASQKSLAVIGVRGLGGLRMIHCKHLCIFEQHFNYCRLLRLEKRSRLTRPLACSCSCWGRCQEGAWCWRCSEGSGVDSSVRDTCTVGCGYSRGGSRERCGGGGRGRGRRGGWRGGLCGATPLLNRYLVRKVA